MSGCAALYAAIQSASFGIAAWGRYYLSARSALTLRQRELVINRTTALCGADYEWGVHIAYFAETARFSVDQIHSLGHGQPADLCWDRADTAVLRAVDELHLRHAATGRDEHAVRVADVDGDRGDVEGAEGIADRGLQGDRRGRRERSDRCAARGLRCSPRRKCSDKARRGRRRTEQGTVRPVMARAGVPDNGHRTGRP